jgi:cytochrome c oxidase subunit 4
MSRMAHSAHPKVGHVVPLQVLFGVLATLLVMTFVTVAVSWFNFGRLNIWIALGIAVFKASLVLLFFMHLKYDKPFNAFVIIVSIAVVILLIAIALTDSAQYEPQRIPGYAPSIKTNPQ